MNFKPIQRALARANIAKAAEDMKLSKRTLFRIKAGSTNINLATYATLEKWAAKQGAAK